MAAAFRDVEAATLALDGSPPITRTTFPTCRAHYPGGSSGCACRLLPRSCSLPQMAGGSASALSLSRPAQASLTLRPAGLLNRLKRPLSRGSSPAGYPTEPLVSYQINRQLSGWNLPPLVIRAFGAHCQKQTMMAALPYDAALLFSQTSRRKRCDPLFDVGADEVGKFLRLTAKWIRALPFQRHLNVFVFQRLVRGARQLLDDRGWRSGRRQKPDPDSGVIARHACLGERRNIRHDRCALWLRHGESLQLAGLDMRSQRRGHVEHQRDAAGKQVGNGLIASALIRRN